MSIDESQMLFHVYLFASGGNLFREGFQSSLEGQIQTICSFGGGADMESVISDETIPHSPGISLDRIFAQNKGSSSFA